MTKGMFLREAGWKDPGSPIAHPQKLKIEAYTRIDKAQVKARGQGTYCQFFSIADAMRSRDHIEAPGACFTADASEGGIPFIRTFHVHVAFF